MDQSGSVGPANWVKMVESLEKVINNMKVSPTKNRIAVSKFNESGTVEFLLDTYDNAADVCIY
jgi:hypothetical protein